MGWGELNWIKNRILLSFIPVPKIQARGHFLTNQIHIITYLFWSLNIFLLISFWAEFSRMFLFCVFSWLVENYKSVTSMFMRFWSEISRMFFSMFLGLIILRLKNVYSINTQQIDKCWKYLSISNISLKMCWPMFVSTRSCGDVCRCICRCGRWFEQCGIWCGDRVFSHTFLYG